MQGMSSVGCPKGENRNSPVGVNLKFVSLAVVMMDTLLPSNSLFAWFCALEINTVRKQVKMVKIFFIVE